MTRNAPKTLSTVNREITSSLGCASACSTFSRRPNLDERLILAFWPNLPLRFD